MLTEKERTDLSRVSKKRLHIIGVKNILMLRKFTPVKVISGNIYIREEGETEKRGRLMNNQSCKRSKLYYLIICLANR